jgi:hypothetical protein
LLTIEPAAPLRPGDAEQAPTAKVQQRADTITAVLAKIMERPEAIRHWGLNE